VTGEQANAVRRKVQAWLAEPDAGAAIALRASPQWTEDPVLHLHGTQVRVVPCPTPPSTGADGVASWNPPTAGGGPARWLVSFVSPGFW